MPYPYAQFAILGSHGVKRHLFILLETQLRLLVPKECFYDEQVLTPFPQASIHIAIWTCKLFFICPAAWCLSLVPSIASFPPKLLSFNNFETLSA
jgi:hypothetical protein